MARSTKASNAVLRLKQRQPELNYTMLSLADGRFSLHIQERDGSQQSLCEPLEIDAFVSFVNNVSKQAPRKASKLDTAFEAQLQRSGGTTINTTIIATSNTTNSNKDKD
jgi:hypothetical protein